jgi:DNA-binding MurR/RpiR family transcriptional regulator
MTPAEQEECIQMYPYASSTELAERFGVGKSSILRLAKRFNLQKSKEWRAKLSHERAVRVAQNRLKIQRPSNPDGTYCPRRLVIEEIEYLLDMGYAEHLAPLVRQRIAFLERQPADWFEDRMHWPLSLWIKRLATQAKGAL